MAESDPFADWLCGADDLTAFKQGAVSDMLDEKEEEEISRKDLVAAALTTIQIESRLPVWQPPRKTETLVQDILTRFCGLDDTKEHVKKATEEELRRDHLGHLDVDTLKVLFNLKLGQALDFHKAAGVVALEEKLESLSIDDLHAIINGTLGNSKEARVVDTTSEAVLDNASPQVSRSREKDTDFEEPLTGPSKKASSEKHEIRPVIIKNTYHCYFYPYGHARAGVTLNDAESAQEPAFWLRFLSQVK